VSYHAAGLAGLGQACPDCTIAVGDRCIPCPRGAPDPECQGCESSGRKQASAEPQPSWVERNPFWGPVAISAAAAVAGGVALVVAQRVGIQTSPGE